MNDHVERANPDMAQVTVVMVTYHSAHCIEAQRENLHGFANMVIVDNASHDDLSNQVAKHLAHAQVIALDTNRGFGAANNLGLSHVKTRFALLLNPDCSIRINDVKQLLDAANHFPGHAIYAPQIYKSDGSHELSYRMPTTYWSASPASPAADAACCVGFATAAAWLVDVEVFQRLKGFDEAIFLYYEDEDFCLRAYQAGCGAILVPQAHATHQSRSSVKEGFPWRSEYLRGYHHAQSKIYFTHKHLSAQKAQSQRWSVLLLALLALPLRILWPQPRYIVRLWGRICGLVQWSRHPLHARKN